MTVDARCLIATDLGILKDGSGLSEDHAQETGLVTYRGTFIFDGVLTPPRGRVIQVAYARPQYGASGLLTRFYPRLHVISSSADPFASAAGVTTVEVGCMLALMADRRDAVTYRAIDHPPSWWSALTADRQAVVPPTIAAQGVIQFCLDRLGITLAAGSATSNDTFLRDEIDLSGGYVQTISDLLKDSLLVGHMTPAGEMLVQSVALEPATGPVLQRENLISLQPINDRGGAEHVTVEFDAFEAPDNTDPDSVDINSDEQKLRDWEFEQTIGPPTTYTVSAIARRYLLGFNGITELPPNESQRIDVEVEATQVSTTRTSYRTIEYTDVDGTSQSQDVAVRRVTQNRTSVDPAKLLQIAGELLIGPAGAIAPRWYFPPSGALPQNSDTIVEYTYEATTEGPRLKNELTQVYDSPLKFGTALPIEVWVANENGDAPYQPLNDVETSRTLVENEVDEVSGLTKRKTTRWMASAKTQQGSQASRLAFEDATSLENFASAFSAAQPLVMQGTEVTISLGRQSGLQSRPSAQARQRDVLSGAFRDDNSLTSSGLVATTYGQREPQKVTTTYAFGGASPELWNTATYRLGYAPDDTITAVNGTSAGIVDLTLLRGNARARALEYGRVQNTIAFGHANGVEVTTAAWELPSAPFAPVYLDVAGLSTAFRVHGRNWVAQNGAFVVTADLMFVGTVGRLSGETPTPWMPLTSPAADLPVIGAPTGSGDILPANTITLPAGFNPAAPGSVWSSLPTNGVDTYGPRRTPGSINPPYVETVSILGVSRSAVVVTELLYSLAPTTDDVLAVSRSRAEVVEVTLVVPPVIAVDVAALAPVVSIGASVIVPAAAVTVAGASPIIAGVTAVEVPAAGIAVAGVVPDLVGRPRTQVLVPAAAVAVAGVVPIVTGGASVTVPAAGVTVSGLAPQDFGIVAIPVNNIIYSQSSLWSGATAANNSIMTDKAFDNTGAATDSSPAWVQMDLGATYDVSKVVIGTATGSIPGGWSKSYTENRNVKYSTDESTWTTAFNTGTFASNGIYTFEVNFTARYIRITIEDTPVLYVAISEFYALAPGQTY